MKDGFELEKLFWLSFFLNSFHLQTHLLWRKLYTKIHVRFLQCKLHHLQTFMSTAKKLTPVSCKTSSVCYFCETSGKVKVVCTFEKEQYGEIYHLLSWAPVRDAFLPQTLPSIRNPCPDLYLPSVRPPQQSAEAPGPSSSYVLFSYTPAGSLRRWLLDMLGWQGSFSTYSGLFWARGSPQFKLGLWGPFFSLSYASCAFWKWGLAQQEELAASVTTIPAQHRLQDCGQPITLGHHDGSMWSAQSRLWNTMLTVCLWSLFFSRWCWGWIYPSPSCQFDQRKEFKNMGIFQEHIISRISLAVVATECMFGLSWTETVALGPGIGQDCPPDQKKYIVACLFFLGIDVSQIGLRMQLMMRPQSPNPEMRFLCSQTIS